MATKTRRSFFEIVENKYEEARETPGCTREISRQGRGVVIAHLFDHRYSQGIVIEPQKNSMIVALDSGKNREQVQVANGASAIEFNPIKLAVEKGSIRPIFSRSMGSVLDENKLSIQRRAIERARPLRLDNSREVIETIDAVRLLKHPQSEQEGRTETLQALSRAMLQASLTDEKYHHQEFEEHPTKLGLQSMIAAQFVVPDVGVIIELNGWAEEGTIAALSKAEEMEASLWFPELTFIDTHDGTMLIGEEGLQLIMDGADVFTLNDGCEAGFSSLESDSLLRVRELFSHAEPTVYQKD